MRHTLVSKGSIDFLRLAKMPQTFPSGEPPRGREARHLMSHATKRSRAKKNTKEHKDHYDEGIGTQRWRAATGDESGRFAPKDLRKRGAYGANQKNIVHNGSAFSASSA